MRLVLTIGRLSSKSTANFPPSCVCVGRSEIHPKIYGKKRREENKQQQRNEWRRNHCLESGHYSKRTDCGRIFQEAFTTITLQTIGHWPFGPLMWMRWSCVCEERSIEDASISCFQNWNEREDELRSWCTGPTAKSIQSWRSLRRYIFWLISRTSTFGPMDRTDTTLCVSSNNKLLCIFDNRKRMGKSQDDHSWNWFLNVYACLHDCMYNFGVVELVSRIL